MERKQVTLRLPGELYELIRKEAERRGMSVNDLLLWELSRVFLQSRQHTVG